MTERCLGVVVSGDKVILVEAEVPDNGAVVINSDQTFSLQTGNRCKAYGAMFQRLVDHCRGRNISRVFIKETARSTAGVKKAHLVTAELRGVVMGAFGSVCDTKTMAKAYVSKNFGERKADDYVADNEFWDDQIDGDLRTGSREAALLILANRE